MKEYILNIIREELDKRYVWANDIDVDGLCDEVIMGGNYAFRLIYSDVDKYDVHITRHSFKLETWRPIDWRLVKQSSVDSGMFSIDGGVRYQWSYYGILFIDPSVVRDKKLEDLGV